MGFEDAGARQAGGLSEAAAEIFGPEGIAGGEAEGPMRGMAFGCSGCAAAGRCRQGLDQEQLASVYMGAGAAAEGW